jgi:hypothetical protein
VNESYARELQTEVNVLQQKLADAHKRIDALESIVRRVADLKSDSPISTLFELNRDAIAFLTVSFAASAGKGSKP